MVSNMQGYIGLDIHKRFLFAVVLDGQGELILERKIRNDPHELDKFFKRFDKESSIALESCSCWEYVYDYLNFAINLRGLIMMEQGLLIEIM